MSEVSACPLEGESHLPAGVEADTGNPVYKDMEKELDLAVRGDATGGEDHPGTHETKVLK